MQQPAVAAAAAVAQGSLPSPLRGRPCEQTNQPTKRRDLHQKAFGGQTLMSTPWGQGRSPRQTKDCEDSTDAAPRHGGVTLPTGSRGQEGFVSVPLLSAAGEGSPQPPHAPLCPPGPAAVGGGGGRLLAPVPRYQLGAGETERGFNPILMPRSSHSPRCEYHGVGELGEPS